MKITTTRRKLMASELPPGSQGFVLLDALIAIVIFSIGILGMVSLQSNAISLSTDAQYRTEAAMLADKIIGEMWSADQTAMATDFAGNAGSGGAIYTSWNTLVEKLPNGQGKIDVSPAGTVTVTVDWQQPSDPVAHTYTTVTQIAY